MLVLRKLVIITKDRSLFMLFIGLVSTEGLNPGPT
jgi:hypothetical protein